MNYLEKKLSYEEFPEDITRIVDYAKSRGVEISRIEVNILYEHWCD